MSSVSFWSAVFLISFRFRYEGLRDRDFDGDESVDALNIPATLIELESSHRILVEARAQAKKWRFGMDLPSKMSEAELLVKRYTDKVKLLEDFEAALREAFQEQSEDVKKAEAKAKRQKRYRKSKLTRILKENKVQDGVSKLVSASCGAVEDFAPLASAAYTAELADAELEFGLPKLLSASDRNATTKWHARSTDYIEKRKEYPDSRFKKSVAAIAKG